MAALVHWATSRSRDQATTYVWIDVLSVSQHLSLDVTQEWWSTVFAEGIRNTGEVVICEVQDLTDCLSGGPCD